MPAHVRIHDYPNTARVMRTRHLNFLVSRKTGYGINKVERLMWAFWDEIGTAMAEGAIVDIEGFGTFKTRWRTGRVRPTFTPSVPLERKVHIGR